MTTPLPEGAARIGQVGKEGAGLRVTALTAAPGTQPPERPRGARPALGPRAWSGRSKVGRRDRWLD